ncbi:MAG: 50S ribosomal protein L35 [Mycoplasmataceae bacterium]|jgi:large subunit ribosomal protein L35|nr:50S ribosomal protein L35 [Mycoplasmataceae bacterium]
MKQKTKKAMAKRFKITATGKVMHHHSNRGHRFFGKSTKSKRQNRKDKTLNPANTRLITRGLPYRKENN